MRLKTENSDKTTKEALNEVQMKQIQKMTEESKLQGFKTSRQKQNSQTLNQHALKKAEQKLIEQYDRKNNKHQDLPSSPKPIPINKVFYTNTIIGLKVPYKKPNVPMARLITGMDRRQTRIDKKEQRVIQNDLRETAERL